MIFTISINQKQLFDFNQKNKKKMDYRHAVILEFFKWFFSSGDKRILDKTFLSKNGERWWWIRYSLISESLISFRLKEKNSIKAILDDLIFLGFLLKRIAGVGQSQKMYFSQGPNFDDFFYFKRSINPNKELDLSRDGVLEKHVPPKNDGGGLWKPPLDVFSGDLEKKLPFGKYKNVLLSEREISEFKQSLKQDFSSVIDWFSHKKQFAQSEYKYKSDYRAIMSWGITSYYKENPKKKNSYTAWLEQNKHKKY